MAKSEDCHVTIESSGTGLGTSIAADGKLITNAVGARWSVRSTELAEAVIEYESVPVKLAAHILRMSIRDRARRWLWREYHRLRLWG